MNRRKARVLIQLLWKILFQRRLSSPFPQLLSTFKWISDGFDDGDIMDTLKEKEQPSDYLLIRVMQF